ncbi:MAG TPA: GTP-binding protein [Usitatibacter sp.]|nr:GTP-binding protein [Usitatibacter sp.]
MNGDPVPVLLIAGAPGAGKTTLLAHWMADPDFANTAVLVNEPGDAAIDEHLVGGLGASTRTLSGGCACCIARRDFPLALEALAASRRAAVRFERVVVELAGLANPAPVLGQLADPDLQERFPLQGLATLVDATAGARAFDDPESRARIAAADVLVLAKGDLVAAGELARLAQRLAHANPHAHIAGLDARSASAGAVWDAAGSASGRALRHLDASVVAARDHEGMRAHTLAIDAPLELSGFCMRLASFLQAEGDRVVRVKGLVAVEGRKGPAVIQAVAGELHPVRTLKDWPPGAAPGALVVVGRGLDPARLAAAILGERQPH